ncbi:hypothetical protein U8527_08305 [Kordia algicida OT-1]|uniref:Uncharacterized protein n=1 Tax=Kordia algicida OT-1 TaxID=391587 RepID=A9E6D8_9FLAO|nr:hypothetical protein [Kordia algicida]EDP95017.1 hypothetical protein KAOT1_01739 [Kordia algicida OT-1]
MTKKITKDSIPLLLIYVLMMVTLIKHVTSDITLHQKHYISFALILVSTFLYFFNRKWFVHFFFFVLLIGTFDLIHIFYINMKITISFININLIFLIVFGIHLILNKLIDDNLFPEKKNKA